MTLLSEYPAPFSCSHQQPPIMFSFHCQAYDEVIVTTKWDADGFLACCMLFAAFTAEVRQTAEVSKDGPAR